jgi:hypothetical protein
MKAARNSAANKAACLGMRLCATSPRLFPPLDSEKAGPSAFASCLHSEVMPIGWRYPPKLRTLIPNVEGVPPPLKQHAKQGTEFGGSGIWFVRSGMSFFRGFHPIK